jgi:hypothetical protein
VNGRIVAVLLDHGLGGAVDVEGGDDELVFIP